MQLYLTVSPREFREASRYPCRFAHAAYRVGEGGGLLRSSLLVRTQGGLMVLSDQNCPAIGTPGQLSRQIWQECGFRSFGGVLADFEAPPSPDRIKFLERLCAILRSHNRRLYLPEAYAKRVSGSIAVICTAISGGNFTQRLEEAVSAFGGGHVALDVQRLTMDFPLPSPTGEGVPISPQQLRQLLEEVRPNTFYSRDLCAKYFTYTREEQAHFVVFDDADTLRRKLHTGRDLGFSAAFLMYPEAADLLPALFSAL